MRLNERTVMDETMVSALLSEEVIIPSGKAADVILCNKEGYHNLMTGEKGPLSDITKEGDACLFKGLSPSDYAAKNGRKYVLIKNCTLDNFLACYRGSYVVKSRKEDALLVLQCKLCCDENGIYHWEEASRTIASKKYAVEWQTRPFDRTMNDFDIIEGSEFLLSFVVDPQPIGWLQRTVLDYLGTGIIIKYDGFENCILNPFVIINILSSVKEDGYYGIVENGSIPELGDIPAHVEMMLKTFCQGYGCHVPYSYLQKTEAGFVQRDFMTVKYLENDKDVFGIYEFQRTLLSPDMIKTRIGNPSVLFWYEGYQEDNAPKPFSGTAQDVLDSCLGILWNGIKEKRTSAYIYEKMHGVTGMYGTGVVEKLCLLLDNKAASAVLHSKMPMVAAKRFLQKFAEAKNPDDVQSVLTALFGDISESGDAVDEMLSLPAGMFSFVAGLGCDFSVIARGKRLFGTRFKDYFKALGREDYAFLVREMTNRSNKSLCFAAKKILASGRVENWKHFLVKMA